MGGIKAHPSPPPKYLRGDDPPVPPKSPPLHICIAWPTLLYYVVGNCEVGEMRRKSLPAH